MTKKTIEKIAVKAVSQILDEGLRGSTFFDNFPDAYGDLVTYRLDMEHDIGKTIKLVLDED